MIFPEPEDSSLRETFKDDIKNWMSQIELYFERHTTTHIVVKSIVFLIGLFSVIFSALELTKTFWPPIATIFLLLTIIILTMIIDFSHVMLAKRRLFALNRTKRLVNNLVKIIRGATDLQGVDYGIIEWKVVHDIDAKGDVNYQRYMKIRETNGNVSWVRVPIGVIDGHPEDRSEDLGIKVINPEDGGRLPWTIIGETDERKTLAILLDPPASTGTDSCFELNLVWRGAYQPLISEHQDKGKMTVEHTAERIEVTFIAPLGLEFTSLRMKDKIGDAEIKTQEDGRSVLIWVAENVEIGEYPYTLNCKKNEP